VYSANWLAKDVRSSEVLVKKQSLVTVFQYARQIRIEAGIPFDASDGNDNLLAH